MPENSKGIGTSIVQIGDAVRRQIQEKQQVILTAHGQSMFPYIQQGDRCTFIDWNTADLKKGDVVLYQSQTGTLIAHRLLADKRDELSHLFYIIKGDTNLKSDPPVYPNQIIGVLAHIKPSRRVIRISHLFYRIWCPFVLRISFASRLLNKYLTFRNRISKKLRP